MLLQIIIYAIPLFPLYMRPKVYAKYYSLHKPMYYSLIFDCVPVLFAQRETNTEVDKL